jgi:hypothetical protein
MMRVNANPRIDPNAPVFGGVPVKMLGYAWCNRCGEYDTTPFTGKVEVGSRMVFKPQYFLRCRFCARTETMEIHTVLVAE